MSSIAVSELRANLMKILKEIEHGAILDITSRGRVVAKLIPPDLNQKKAKEELLKIGEEAKIYDIISPIDEDWETDNL